MIAATRPWASARWCVSGAIQAPTGSRSTIWDPQVKHGETKTDLETDGKNHRVFSSNSRLSHGVILSTPCWIGFENRNRSLGDFDHQRRCNFCCLATRSGSSFECHGGGSLRHGLGEKSDVHFAKRHRGGSLETSPGSDTKTSGRWAAFVVLVVPLGLVLRIHAAVEVALWQGKGSRDVGRPWSFGWKAHGITGAQRGHCKMR